MKGTKPHRQNEKTGKRRGSPISPLSSICVLRAKEKAGDVTAGMLADLIELFNEKPKRRAIKRIPPSYARLLSRAGKEPLPVESGPITGAQRELLRFEMDLRNSDEAAFRELARKRAQDLLFPLLDEEGLAAGAAAYKGEHSFNPAQPEPRNSRCFLGNFVAEHKIRHCVNLWLEKYEKGYETAGHDDRWKHSPRGIDDPKKPVPHPHFYPALHEAFTRRLQQARAAHAKHEKYADVKRDCCEAYRKGEIRDRNGKRIDNKKAAASTYYKNLPLKKQRVFKNDSAACSTLSIALSIVKKPKTKTA